MATNTRAALERDLNRSLVLLRIIERALHDLDAVWQMRSIGGRSHLANVEVSGRTVTFQATLRDIGELPVEGVYLLLNGEPIKWHPFDEWLSGDIEVKIEISLDHHVLA